ncbi:hypothetical protein AB0J86_10915 [Micromonospora sp. NPDC049559]
MPLRLSAAVPLPLPLRVPLSVLVPVLVLVPVTVSRSGARESRRRRGLS